MKAADSISVNSQGSAWGTDAAHYAEDKTILRKRHCTDLYCLLILFIFVGSWMAVGYYAYWNGDISRIFAPTDSYGRVCGVHEDVKDAKYLFFYDITKCISTTIFVFGCPTKQVCRAQCPTDNWFSFEELEKLKYGTVLRWRDVQNRLICDSEDIVKSVNSYEAFERVIAEEKCAAYYVKSTSAFFNLCIPTPLGKEALSEDTFGLKNQTQAARIYLKSFYEFTAAVVRDFTKCWHLLLLFCVTAVMCCLFLILIMGVLTKVFVWSILTLLLVVLFSGTVLTYHEYDYLSSTQMTQGHQLRNASLASSFPYGTIYGELQRWFERKETWLVLFCISASLFAAAGLLILFLRSRISMAVMLIGEGSKAINKVKSTLCFPLVTRLLQMGVVVWFLLVYLYIRSIGDVVYKIRGLEADQDCQCRDYKEDDWCLPSQFKAHCTSRVRGGACTLAECVSTEIRSPNMMLYFQLFNFFGLLWGTFFVSGLNRTILSYCFASWYWTYNKNDVPFLTLSYSFLVTVRYHLGTVALGSFLIATCGFVRFILERVHKLVKKSEGLVAECAMWSLRSCFWLLQKFLIFISNNAYIMCTIDGQGFFSSASEAFGLLTRNVIRVVVLDKVMEFLMFVGKFTVTFMLGLISYFSFSSQSMGLSYPWIPTTVVAIFTWVISSSFFGVYSIAVDTLFLSFLKDGEINDGSQSKPYYMSHRLKCMLKKNAKKKELEE